MHLYISCYFYDQEESPLRRKLKEEFISMYPWVHLVQEKGRAGFQDYSMVNEYLYKLKNMCGYYIESVTLIDADLILQHNFRTLIETKIREGYDIIHGANLSHELIDEKEEFDEMKSITKDSPGFSGFIWSFSRKFLERIDYTFPTKFLIGGLDWLFALSFIKQREEQVFIDLLGRYAYMIMYEDFFNQTKGFKAITLDHHVIHRYHGPRSERLTDFKMYKNIYSPVPNLNTVKYLINEREKFTPGSLYPVEQKKVKNFFGF